MTEQDLIYALALQHVPKIGATTAKKLINHCGSAEAVLKEKKSNLLRIDGIGTITIEGLYDAIHFEEAENDKKQSHEIEHDSIVIQVLSIYKNACNGDVGKYQK